MRGSVTMKTKRVRSSSSKRPHSLGLAGGGKKITKSPKARKKKGSKDGGLISGQGLRNADLDVLVMTLESRLMSLRQVCGTMSLDIAQLIKLRNL